MLYIGAFLNEGPNIHCLAYLSPAANRYLKLLFKNLEEFVKVESDFSDHGYTRKILEWVMDRVNVLRISTSIQRLTTTPKPEEKIRLDRYWWRVFGQIARGGYGVVRSGAAMNGDPVALKFIPIEPGSSRELNLGMVKQPNYVIPVLDSGEHRGEHVLVMPFAEKTLRDQIASSDNLSLRETLEILTQIAEGLVEIERVLVHRDIKPANVLFHDGRWKLTDFGASRGAHASTGTITVKWVGTQAYMAPERWKNMTSGSACDVYALGVIAYEMIVGERPFTGEDLRHEHLNVKPPRIRTGPQQVADLVDECLEKEESDRPTPAELARRLEDASRSC